MKKCFVAVMACVLSAFLVSGALADEAKKPDWKKGCQDGFVRKSLDKDGFVDLKALPKEVAPQVKEFLKKADADKNGKVTKEEVRNFVQKVRADWKSKMDKQAKNGKDRGPRPDFAKGKCSCCDKCNQRPDCRCCDKCPCGKAPFPPKPNFGPGHNGPNPMIFAELMKKAYKDGFQDGFKAAMEMQKKDHHHGHHAQKPGDWKHGKPGDWKHGKPGPAPATRDGKGPDFGKKDRPDRPRFEDPFKKFGDGKEIDLGKLPKDVWPRFVECLKASDKDKNGKVTRDEFGKFMKERWEAKKAEKDNKDNKDKK